MFQVDVLVPTINRIENLSLTLLSLYYQDFKDFRVIISNQGSLPEFSESKTLKTIFNLHKKNKREILVFNHKKKGLAEQRQFLLELARSPYILFLDDDVILETFVLKKMFKAIKKFKCGFVGQALIGLSFLGQKRKEEEKIEFWEKNVKPEKIIPNRKGWQRHRLHNAANVYHLQERMKISFENPKPYKIAWLGGCVLYDRKKLVSSGGFSFWKKVPKKHSGEDVQAEIQVMEKFGGCGLLPSGAYHLETETTIKERKTNIPEYLIEHGKN